jgi:methionine-rich copper-binding protein CopC
MRAALLAVLALAGGGLGNGGAALAGEAEPGMRAPTPDVAAYRGPWPSPRPTGEAGPFAHTELQATFPAADTVHRLPIEEIRLRFSTAVQLDLSTVTVLGPAGVLRDADSLAFVTGSEERELRLSLRAPLTNGTYTVEWRSAGPDGHPIRGSFAFGVDWEPAADTASATSDTAVAAPAAADSVRLSQATRGPEAPGPASPAALARWLLYLVMAGSLGGALFNVAVVARVARAPDLADAADAARGRLALMGWAAALAGVASLPALLGLQAVALFGDQGLAPANLARLVASAWGQGWLLQASGVALLIGGLAWARRGRGAPGWALIAAAGLALALGSALSGHARAEQGWLPIAGSARSSRAATAGCSWRSWRWSRGPPRSASTTGVRCARRWPSIPDPACCASRSPSS